MKRMAAVACLLSICSCSGLTCSQNRHRAIRHMNAGVKHFSDGIYAAALTSLKAAVREDDTFDKAHYNLANVLLKQGKIDDAITHYAEAIRLRPNFAEAHGNLAFALLNRGQPDEALAHARQAVRLRPSFANAYKTLRANTGERENSAGGGMASLASP